LLTDTTLQDVSVPVETKNSGGAHVHEHRKLTLDIERGWANGTTVKFARRAQDVTGNIVVKLQQVLFETASFDCARVTRCRQVPHESFSRDGDNLHVTGAICTPQTVFSATHAALLMCVFSANFAPGSAHGLQPASQIPRRPAPSRSGADYMRRGRLTQSHSLTPASLNLTKACPARPFVERL
jgi:hypothetical protein